MSRLAFALVVGTALLSAVASTGCSCGAGTDPLGGGGEGAGSSGGNGTGGFTNECPRCELGLHVDCDGNETDCEAQDLVCDAGLGCVQCNPGEKGCVGNEVHECDDQGNPSGPLVETCDVSQGLTCFDGECKTGCEIAADQPSNVGCEFFAVDLDQSDYLNDPASAPWGVALSNASDLQANVTIEINNAAPGEPLDLETVAQVSVPAGTLNALVLPTRELDCGAAPNDHNAPGTCLSSRAFRITSSSPIIVYQFNVFENAYSNDASVLLPTNALGQTYRILGWVAGHPVEIPQFGFKADRSYITVVGTQPGTEVTVRPSWKIRGNPPIAATAANGEITATLGPFDVLNLETDDASMSDDFHTATDLSGSAVYSTKPVSVFSGVETTSAPAGVLDEFPKPPGWESDQTCCLDHLEDQMFPVESIGMKYMIPRSPVRSEGFREPDVIRFVGAAEVANVTTSLPAPFNSFTLQPGEVRTTWTQDNVTVTSDKPVIVGQILINNNYTTSYIGDPSLTVFPPVDQFRTEYVILAPGSWSESWVVFVAEVGATVTLDGAAPTGCIVESGGMIDGVTYETRTCPIAEGAHNLSGDKRFGIAAYGYGSAGSYAHVGGADVKRIYEPPPPE